RHNRNRNRRLAATSVANSAASTATMPIVRPHAQPRGKGLITVTPSALIALIATGALGAAALAVRGAPSPLQFNVPLLAHLSGMLAAYGVASMLVHVQGSRARARGRCGPSGALARPRGSSKLRAY